MPHQGKGHGFSGLVGNTIVIRNSNLDIATQITTDHGKERLVAGSSTADDHRMKVGDRQYEIDIGLGDRTCCEGRSSCYGILKGELQ
ncbi:hypothetical protein SDC9_80422 [bioreactor metagenome]|uniref:Uncharacterized protein n=1 Tax=bioreactor metagenome TaxID=1076179 RepID=A0A644Z1G0_9ZZZZ